MTKSDVLERKVIILMHYNAWYIVSQLSPAVFCINYEVNKALIKKQIKGRIHMIHISIERN